MRDIWVRVKRFLMMWIDILVPVVALSVAGTWIGKFEIGLALGMALGLVAYFRHWNNREPNVPFEKDRIEPTFSAESNGDAG